MLKTNQKDWEYWKDELTKEIKKLGAKYDTWHVFNDFITMVAIAISNGAIKLHFAEREKQYMDIINKYDPVAQQQFAVMNKYLINALECTLPEYRDVLGDVCQELSLTNKDLSQDFTPYCMSKVIAEVLSEDSLRIIAEEGFLKLSEPTVGGGSIVLAYAECLAREHSNPRGSICITAVDISFKCVCMAYIQLSYYGIPAVVIYGDTILVKEYSRWYTPEYLWGDWLWRCKCGLTDGFKADDEALKQMSVPFYRAARIVDNLWNMREI